MAMVVDLDSFLDTQTVDSDVDDPQPCSIPLRTVDEILLLNDSSSSAGSPSPPSSPAAASATRHRSSSSSSYSYSFSRPQLLQRHHGNDDNSNHSVSNSSNDDVVSQVDIPESQRLSHSLSLDSKFSNSSPITTATGRIKSPDFPSSRDSTGALLPPLFTAVRSNAKPGAALAAAAAASRSIPTPHAAAIKSSRTSSTPALFRVLGDSKTSTSSTAVCDSELRSDSVPGVSDEVGGVDHKWANFKSAREVEEIKKTDNGSLQFSSVPEGDRVQEEFNDHAGAFLGKEMPQIDAAASVLLPEVDEQTIHSSGEVSSTYFNATHVDSPAQIENDLNFDEDSATPSSMVDSEGQQFLSSSLDNDYNNEDSQFNSAHGTAEKEITPFPHSEDRKNFHENEDVKIDKMHDQDNIISQSKDDFVNIRGDDTCLEEDIAEIVQDVSLHLESKKSNSKTSKKSEPALRPLELAEELEKKQAFTGMHWEEGAAAQPMRLEGVRRGSTVLGYFDVDANNVITGTISSQAFRREHGFPMVLAVHLNCISVGMSKGVIIVAPSKYSPYHSDNMDAKMSLLGLQGDRSFVPVTSLCFNQQGDLLFAGYGDGHCTVWDVQKVSALKVITEHKSPVVHMLYLGQDSQVTRQFNVVTGDSKGVVKLIRFSVVPWVNRISYSKAMKLLDETTSAVICASPLLSGDYHGGAQVTSQCSSAVSTSAIGSMMGGVIGGDTSWKNSSLVEDGVVIFVTHQSALVAKVSPTVEVYAQIPKPDGTGEGSMPYAAWKYMSDSHLSSTETSEKFALLALAWDRKVQVAKLVKAEIKVYGKWTLDSPAVGLAWLNDQMLVVLTSVGQLCLFAKDGNMIHQTSFAVDGSRGDDLISYHTYFNNTYGNPEKAHHNCLAVRGASIYVLGPSNLVVSRLLPWKERIEVLRRAGDWMGALNMAMTLFDGQAHGVIDLPRALHDVQRTIMPYLAELLLSYVDEVFSYIEVASGNQVGNSDQSDESKSRNGFDHPDIKEQYIRVGGVAVEFCVHIKRTDILFDEIFSKFYAAKNKETFLELLEPYILKDMLGSLPPAIMQALVEHYSKKGWLQRVEQCVLHMDISSLDFNQVVRLCREHRLHGALIYLFNKGLGDFRTPLEELMVILRNCQLETSAVLGYRILVYLKYCFRGLAFPPGQGTLSPTRLPYIRKELLQFLLEDSSAPNSWAVTNLPSKRPNLCHLLELDTEATLEVLFCAFEDNEIPKSNPLSQESMNANVDSNEVEDSAVESQNLVQELVDVLSVILEMSYFQGSCSTSSDGGSSFQTWPSKKDAGRIFEFIAYYVACQRAKVSRDILSQILEYLTSEISLLPCQTTTEASKRMEKQVLALLEVVPEADWDAPYLLHLCEKSQFHQVCGLIHAIGHQTIASLDSYMKAVHEPIHAFSFIRYMLQQLNDRESESDAFRAEVISRIPNLVQLSREGTFFLVLENFHGQSQHVLLSELQSHPESLFLYLKTLIEVHSTGNLDFSCLRKDGDLDNPSGKKAKHQPDKVKTYLEALTDFPKILRNNPIHVTDEMTELYFELLCRYEQKSVLKFLETFESYRVESCLHMCQEYGIVDGAAFLLERVGEVGSALLLILSGLNDKFLMLNAAIASEPSDSCPEHFYIVLKKKEVKDILDVVHSCIGLCQRNSPRLDSHESEHLWFQLLDSFCEPLVDSCSSETRSRVETHIKILEHSLHKQEDEDACKIQWKISKSHKHAHILRKLLSLFIKEIIEGMIGYVRLPTIMLKLLSDNGGQEFGDFKLTILGMLGTYDFERRILDTAKSLIEDDTFYTMSLLKKGASHGYAPRSLLCCVCNGLLTKNSQSSGIRVFSCGHAMHVHCEVQEHETSIGGSSSWCPICVPRKKAQRSRNKSVLVENGLVSKASSRSHQAPGAVQLHIPDIDVFENSYGSHPIPRFELLNNLQKEQRSIQIENMPQLRLAPPAVYHEKVKKRVDLTTGQSSSGSSKVERSGSRQLRDVKMKGSSVRLPLRSNIFGKEKKKKQ